MRGRPLQKFWSKVTCGAWCGPDWIMTLSSDSIAPPIGSDRTAAPVGLARAALFWERVWVRLWPASGVLGALLAAALAGLFEPLAWIFHALLIAVAVTAAGL